MAWSRLSHAWMRSMRRWRLKRSLFSSWPTKTAAMIPQSRYSSVLYIEYTMAVCFPKTRLQLGTLAVWIRLLAKIKEQMKQCRLACLVHDYRAAHVCAWYGDSFCQCTYEGAAKSRHKRTRLGRSTQLSRYMCFTLIHATLPHVWNVDLLLLGPSRTQLKALNKAAEEKDG